MTRPLPKPTPESQPYWDALKQRKLVLPLCIDCTKPHFYPRVVCPHCGSRRLEWRDASGRGTLYSFVINHRPPAWRKQEPYVIAVVELDEGPRMMTNLIGIPPDPALIRCDMPVEIVYEDVTPVVTLPQFRPI
ncbi:MAG: Zn-ribbon domain-containing OB-fold protein [Burkholderiales bacterium]